MQIKLQIIYTIFFFYGVVFLSTAQTSYGQLVGHFLKLKILLQSEPTYNPNENNLKITALTNYLEELTLANADVIGAI